jgi:RNA polymerase sigma-70 factor (ECF subfamily)
MPPSDRLERRADEELMRLVADANGDAFEIVYDRHASAAYSLAYRVVGSRPAADDVVQEAFMAVWRSAARFDPALGSVRSWVLSICHNRAIDALRRITRHAEQPEVETVEREDAEEVALRRVEAADTRRLLADLPDDQRRVIELAFFSGYTHTEIAALVGVPLGTVKGRMRLGLERIRRAMEATPR